MSKRKTVRVGIKAMLYQGQKGYRVRWVDGAKDIRSYFVLDRHDARYVKARAKDGRLPGQSVWAVKV
jgi:hypothetical protein